MPTGRLARAASCCSTNRSTSSSRKLVLNGPAGANEHLDAVDGRYWLRLEWRALARALRESGELRAQAVRDALAFRQARHTRYPDKVESERALYITEGLASYTQTVLAAPSQADAIARALELLAGAEDGESFVRTFTYNSGPAYGLLLDAASPGWPRTVRGSDDPPAMLMRALGVQPVADAAAAAARYGGAELRAAEEQREQQRQARIAELRQRFVDGPVFVMPCGGGGTSNSLGAVVIPGAGTVYFNPYRLSGACGTLAAENGVLEASDGGSRRLPAPVRGDDATISGDGWTFKAAAGLGGARRTRAGATTKSFGSSRERELKRSIGMGTRVRCDDRAARFRRVHLFSVGARRSAMLRHPRVSPR